MAPLRISKRSPSFMSVSTSSEAGGVNPSSVNSRSGSSGSANSVTPHSSGDISHLSAAWVSAVSSQSKLAAPVALSAKASSRPSRVSKSMSVRFTATISSPVVSTIKTFSKPICPAFSTVLFPAIIRLFLSKRIERPAPNWRRLFSIKLWPNCVPLLKFTSSGISWAISASIIFFGAIGLRNELEYQAGQ